MDKLTAIKIKYQDGTYSEQIPIGASIQNIDWDENHNLVDILGEVDLSKGNIQRQINSKPDLGETSSTAYRGDRGKIAYNHATDSNRLTTSRSTGLYKVAATSEGHIANLTSVTKSDITKLGIPAEDHITTATTSGSGNAVTSISANNQGALTITKGATFVTNSDGVSGSSINRFGICDTAANVAEKTTNITSGTFSLVTGATVAVKFTYTNTANSPTLNVGNTRAKSIYVNGVQITSGENKSLLSGTVEFIYDGTHYNLIGAGSGNVTGVKGDKESSYRTGNINITPSNIGATMAEELTEAEYNALSESEKLADKIFLITDSTKGYLAEEVSYDNTDSGLTATNVQDAIDEIDNKFVDDVGDNVTAWLNEHVNPVGSAAVVDDTLTIAGAAADAKKTGDEISLLKKDLSATANAKKTEDEISLLKEDLSYVIAPTIDTKKPRAKNRYLSLAGTKAYKNAILNSYGLLEPSTGSENNWVSEYIKIPTDKLDINIVCRGCSLCVAYYDKTYNFVSFYNDNATPNINGNSNTVISVPNNAEYIRFGFWSSTGYSDEKYYNTFRAYNIIDDLDYSEFDELAPSLPWGFTQPDNKPNIVFSMDSVGTAGFVKFNKPVIITPVSGYKCAITFKNTTKSGDVISSWYPNPTNGPLFVPADLDVWIGIRPVNTSQEICLPENICKQVSIKYIYDNIIYPAPQSVSFLNGYIIYGQKLLKDRCFTSHFIRTDEDVLFHIRNNTAVYTIIIYSGNNIDYTDSQNWSIYYSRREDIIIPSGSWYCFSVGCSNADEVTAKESYEIIPLTKNFFAPMYKSFARSLIANLGSLGRRIAQLESNTVPQYYEEHITQKINTINSRYSSSNDQFIFITDVHLNGYGGNPGHSKSLINRIALNTAITKVINGGDLLNRPNKLIDDPKTKRDVLSIIEQAASYSRPDTGIPQYLIIGNHDSGVDYPDGTRYAGVISVDEYMAYSGFNMIKPLVISDDKSDTQYYFDENGIRYIILNTELRDEIPTNETYTDSWRFISLALASMPNGFHAIIMPHVLMINPDTQAGDFTSNLFTLVDAYNSRGTASYGTASANFTNCVGRVAAIICGHSHMDFNLTTTNGVPVIITTTDNGRAEISRSTLTRTIGTVSEQAFDVFSIDKTNRKIYATRIGAGEDREFSY